VDFVRPIEAIVPGAQGRVLAVLLETTAELNLRTIAQLAGISQAQASRLLPDLVALGVVERREVPPASLFRLVPEHVASRALLALARSTSTVLDEMGRLAGALAHRPVSVIVFGSFARPRLTRTMTRGRPRSKAGAATYDGSLATPSKSSR
jgi:hypothetical protein